MIHYDLTVERGEQTLREDVAEFRRPRSTKRVRIDAEALTKVGASEFLAIDSASMRSVALSPEPSGAPAVVSGIGVVRIDGPLAQRAEADMCGYVDGYDAIASRVIAAHESDADVVLVLIDSPGGDVAGIEEGIRRMQAAQAVSGKPVVVHIDEMAASAAYWIASAIATDGIFAPAAGRVGSIGCIGCTVDETESLRMAGVSVTIVRAPDGKAESHPAGPVSDLAEQRLRAGVERIAKRFYAAVAERRGIAVADVEAMNGEVFDAPEAKRRGLIDGVGGMDSTVAKAARIGAKRRREQQERAMAETEMAQFRARAEKAESTLEAVAMAAGAKSADEIVGKIEALKMANAANAAAAAKVAEIEKMLAAQAEEKRQAEIVALVDGGISANKIAPAQRDEFLAKAQKHGAEYVSDFLAMVSPIVHGPGSAPKAQAVTDDKIDAELAASLRRAGVTEEDFKKFGRISGEEG